MAIVGLTLTTISLSEHGCRICCWERGSRRRRRRLRCRLPVDDTFSKTGQTKQGNGKVQQVYASLCQAWFSSALPASLAISLLPWEVLSTLFRRLKTLSTCVIR